MNVPRNYPEDSEAAQHIAKWMRKVMERRGWDQSRLAEELEINKATVSRMLSGGRGVGVGLALRISRRLLIDPYALLFTDPQ